MEIKKISIAIMILAAPFLNSCKNRQAASTPTVKEAIAERTEDENNKKVEALNHDYPKIPDERILENGDGSPLYAELK